jgi:hypothetical protein
LYERRAQLESRAPLTLVTTLEIDEIPTAELMITFDDTTFKKVMVPTHDLESLEQVLYCYHEFLEAARKLNLDNAEWFDYYRDTLRGHARIAWDVLANATLPRNRNERTFKATFRLFITTIVDETAYRSLMEYLRTTVKPRNMSVMEVSRRFQVLCMYAEDLPMESGEMPVPLRADEMKSMFYNMMPEEWKDTFTRGNLRMSSMSLSQMAIYFNSLGSMEGPKNQSGKKRKGADNNYSSNNNSRNNRQRNNHGRYRGNRNDNDHGNNRQSGRGGRGNGRGRGGRGNRNGNGGRNNYQRLHGEDTCPVHGRHKWRECFLNPHGDDYRPRNGNQGNNNSQNRGNGSRRGDAYHSNNNDGNGSRGNGSNGNNNNQERNNNNSRERREETVSSSRNDDHYMNDIGTPEWN